MESKKGNYVGKKIGDYAITGKNRVNKRTKYLIKCSVCGVEKWVFNISNLIHGSFCEGKKRKTGSSLIGVVYGDYIVVKKIIKNRRSAYVVKCTICNSIKEVWNLRIEKHNESCTNFLDYIIGKINEDFIIYNAYKEDRVYIDVKCLVCGCTREKVAYKDFKLTFKNTHSKHCTIKNVIKFGDKKLIRKLIRTFANMKSRCSKEVAYEDVEVIFRDTTEFICYVYDMYVARLEEGVELKNLSIDRINPFGNYEKGNVRCLTLSEQQSNKRIHYRENVETIETSGCAEGVE